MTTTTPAPRIPTGKVGRSCMTPTISDLALTVIAVIVTIALFNGWG